MGYLGYLGRSCDTVNSTITLVPSVVYARGDTTSRRGTYRWESKLKWALWVKLVASHTIHPDDPASPPLVASKVYAVIFFFFAVHFPPPWRCTLYICKSVFRGLRCDNFSCHTSVLLAHPNRLWPQALLLEWYWKSLTTMTTLAPTPATENSLQKAALTIAKQDGPDNWRWWSPTIKIVLDHTWDYVESQSLMPTISTTPPGSSRTTAPAIKFG